MQRQVVTWRRNRKLVLQLWAISTLYLGTWMPLEISGLINLYWDPNFLLQFQIDYIYLFPYFIHVIYPFIVLFFVRSKDIQNNH
jgi:phosphatidylglycerophosphate synthase